MMNSDVSPTQKILNVWAVVLIIWSFYRATFRMSLPIWVDECIAKPLIFLFPIFWFISRSEKKSILTGLGFTRKNNTKDILFGIAVGSMFICAALLVRAIKGLPFLPHAFSVQSMVWIASSISAAVMEQILSTGFVFKRLSEESKNIFRPFIISALLFFFLHFPSLFGVDKISGSTLLQIMILNTVLSLTTSLVFILRKNTISPILVHALYLLSIPILL